MIGTEEHSKVRQYIQSELQKLGVETEIQQTTAIYEFRGVVRAGFVQNIVATIKGKETFIYTENGVYNSKKNIGNFLRKSSIKYKDRLIEGDSLYYDRKTEFASGTNNVKITDSINKAIIKGHYGEIYKQKDSVYITKHASIRYKVENDSMYVYGVWDVKPTWKELKLAYEQTLWFRRSDEEIRDIKLKRLLGNV
jgi:lipopolysaccharide assembly outer membrane protein LptD (OstA)